MDSSLYINSISPDVGILSTLPTQDKHRGAPKKHITQVIHYETPEGKYDGTNIAYRWSYRYTWIFTNTNIYEDEEFSWLVNSYEKRLSVIRGAHIYYYSLPKAKRFKNTRPVPQAVNVCTHANNIIITLEEPHYTYDEDDNEYFRFRSCRYNINLFPNLKNGIHWTQDQLRPCRYVESYDESASFDCNTYHVYFDIKKVKNEFTEHVKNIVYCDAGNRKKHVRDFVRSLYNYTMWLYYINTSWGWKFEEMNYENLWNLAMYILNIVKPFEPGSETKENWLPFVKVSYVRYLFEKRVYNGCTKGLKFEYSELSKKLPKVTRYYFPKDYDKFSREMFKLQYLSGPAQKRLERNMTIKKLNSQGLSVRKIAKELDCSPMTVSRVLKKQ